MAVRIGVVGAGSMGAGHARMLAREVGGCEVRTIVDADGLRAAALARSLGVALSGTDGMAAVRDTAVDAVLVASPDETHHALVMECIRLKKPVLCEKPLAPTSAECREIVEAERSGGLRLVQVGFMRRFDPGYRTMKAALTERRHGDPLFLHSIHRNASAPDYVSSENTALSGAVHDVDIARHLLAEEFVDVCVRRGRATRSAPHRVPQFITLETAGGVLVSIEMFLDAQYAYDVRAELVCETATIALVPPGATVLNAGLAYAHGLQADWNDRFGDAYRAQLQAWIGSIADGTPVGASAWDGYVATRTAEACLKSLVTGERVRLVPETVPDFYAEAGETAPVAA